MKHQESIESRPETPIDETESDLCRALWIAVAIQAIIDATSKSRKKCAIKERSAALQWLADHADEDSDLAMVCDLAGIDFKMLRKKFKEVLRNPENSIDFRCLKKAGIDNRENESRQRYFARARKNERLRKERDLHKKEQHSELAAISPFCELVQDRLDDMKCAS